MFLKRMLVVQGFVSFAECNNDMPVLFILLEKSFFVNRVFTFEISLVDIIAFLNGCQYTPCRPFFAVNRFRFFFPLNSLRVYK